MEDFGNENIQLSQEVSNQTQNTAPQTQNSFAPLMVFYQKHKKTIWIVLGIIAAIYLIYLFMPTSYKGKYVGTESGTNKLGTPSSWETVVELKSNEKYSITVTHLQSGNTTFTSQGTYKMLGESGTSIVFTDSKGTIYQGEMQVSLRNQLYIFFSSSSGLPSSCGYASSCYKS